MIYPPGPDIIQMQYKSKKFADCLVNNQHSSAFQTTNLGACTNVMEVLHDICDRVHMYTATQSLLISTLLSSERNIGGLYPP